MNHTPKDNNISIIWDFDKTLIPMDSTTQLIEFFIGDDIRSFWKEVQDISGVGKGNSISKSDAPVWMYLLSEMAQDPQTKKNVALNIQGIGDIIQNKITPYKGAFNFLKEIKNLSSKNLFQKNNISIHHFIITAGLKDLVAYVLEKNKSESLIHEIFGCKYKVIEIGDTLKNIPIYCMDKTTKTRALFEICKGCFKDEDIQVDDFVLPQDEWCPFENMIYIGDGDTDIPAFSLVKARNGMTIGVFNPEEKEEKRRKQSKNMIEGRRIDLFTPADFSNKGELFKFIKIKCELIAKRYNVYMMPT